MADSWTAFAFDKNKLVVFLGVFEDRKVAFQYMVDYICQILDVSMESLELSEKNGSCQTGRDHGYTSGLIFSVTMNEKTAQYMFG